MVVMRSLAMLFGCASRFFSLGVIIPASVYGFEFS
jgi:hypothetical protein